jgi:uncharacterized membrane-anchored protein YitT (DUF2179 family)
MEELSKMNQSEVDINILISLYNQKISNLINQNVLLEAKVQSLIKDFSEDKNKLLMVNLELQKKVDELTIIKKSTKTDIKTEKVEDYEDSEINQ